MSNKSFLFIVNPVSGVKDNLAISKIVLNILNQSNIDTNVIYTTHKGHAKEYITALNQPTYHSIIVLGGDGTINEVINGLLLRQDKYLPKLCFLPGGTGNSVLHDLQYLDPISALEPIFNNSIKYIDVMALQFKNFIEYSINILGWGLVSDIAILAEKLRMIGSVRYNLASLYYILKLQSRHCTINIDGKKYQDNYLFILIHNTIHTGKGMKAAPNAKLDDGFLDIVLINSDVSRLQLIQLLSKLYDGSHIDSEYVKYFPAQNIELIPKEDEAVNIDGDVKYKTPVKISVLEKKLPIYC